MRYLKSFKIFEFVTFNQGRMTDWEEWSSESELSDIESNFPDYLFEDIEDILSDISEVMSTNLTYDIINDNNNKILIIKVSFDRKGSIDVTTSKFVDPIYHLIEYMRENNYMNSKISIRLDGDKYSENSEGIIGLLDEMSNRDDKVIGTTIEFIKKSITK